MRLFKTELDGVMLLTPKIYEDFRGTNHESYNEAEYEKVTNTKFVVDSIST
jgi:dTDP-4-dehydrorhamnose 3,5-epimerase-like enzyme